MRCGSGRGSAAGLFSFKLHPASRRGKRTLVMSKLSGGDLRRDHAISDANARVVIHKDADLQLGGGKRYKGFQLRVS
ncbi:hypothetical protein TNCV_1950501 [Trichonephila clavipes]|nr:hypothetical protein TNCV_1950501 [Trichonephila clavipes]